MSRPLLIVTAAAVLIMVAFTLVEAKFSDRWSGSNVTAEEFSQLLSNVPMEIGAWQGMDDEVSEESRQGAGAVGQALSREYYNPQTGDRVRLWLIVGHSRDICRHTPDVCFPSSGFKAIGKENLKKTIEIKNDEFADFWTNAFIKEDSQGRHLVRVFWSWYKPNEEGEIQWEAPDRQRFHFGNSPALYKMYFSAEQKDPKETAERSLCVDFAKEFIPEVEKALSISHLTGGEATAPSEEAGEEQPAPENPEPESKEAA